VIIAVALGVIAVASVLLWLPVLMDHINAFLAKQGSKYGWQTVAVGLVLLIVGLITHVPILAIIGGVAAGVVIAAAIVDNY
jgi:Kef-type K+ transport system membrane component KefB